jgi:hypothetical protein
VGLEPLAFVEKEGVKKERKKKSEMGFALPINLTFKPPRKGGQKRSLSNFCWAKLILI